MSFELRCLTLFAVRGMLALVLWLTGTEFARAEKEQFAYELDLSASKTLLQYPGAGFDASRLLGDQINMRNNPWLKLTNTSRDATLDRFVMTVGDDAYRYSKATVGTKTGTFDVDVNLIDGGQKLELVFDNFNPGETVFVKFQLRPLDPDAYQYPDFRNVLFKANSTDTSQNAVVTSDFYDPVAKQDDTLTGQLPNFPITTGDTAVSSCPRCTCYPPSSGGFQVFSYGQGNSLTPQVPEPSSMVLALLGAVSLLLAPVRRRLGMTV